MEDEMAVYSGRGDRDCLTTVATQMKPDTMKDWIFQLLNV
jgi:hypothetical protein